MACLIKVQKTHGKLIARTLPRITHTKKLDLRLIADSKYHLRYYPSLVSLFKNKAIGKIIFMRSYRVYAE